MFVVIDNVMKLVFWVWKCILMCIDIIVVFGIGGEIVLVFCVVDIFECRNKF